MIQLPGPSTSTEKSKFLSIRSSYGRNKRLREEHEEIFKTLPLDNIKHQTHVYRKCQMWTEWEKTYKLTLQRQARCFPILELVHILICGVLFFSHLEALLFLSLWKSPYFLLNASLSLSFPIINSK